MITNGETGSPTTDGARATVRHLVATLAYRAAKVLRTVPHDFGSRSFGATTRRPVRVLAHMADLMAWGARAAHGEMVWKAEGSDDWDTEVHRFFDRLAAIDRELEGGATFGGSFDKLIAGPLADALTHVGQLAMLRGMAGIPVRPESYPRAPITIGRVGLDQDPPGREFDDDASMRR